MVKEAVINAKAQEVSQVAEQLKNAATTVVVDYIGLTVEEVTDLRKQLRDAGVQMKVVKNTMLRRAVAEADIEVPEDLFKGPSAIIFSDDVVAPAKIAVEFAKNNETLEIRGGIVEGVATSKETIEQVAKMPGREELLSMLLSVLQAPMRNVASVLSQANPAQQMVYALNGVIDQKGAA
ncbi:50S ribosomal protein L10 [Facklamia sp. DSM 111018]|uniref:Large ribosomal subunit protein uL10 n=1 Tax=Facklamia lactis TaxID=2749967 RepID=A0ABS0LSX0_9LACT|nr:50S ribosomal protein L10 [Facklamia lactis]MBG9981272.1 50S ribosomal protein L10 [Facklamia lactis]MBG9987251.1 50S ribosomal protein L10 [Facklamia lactis]